MSKFPQQLLQAVSGFPDFGPGEAIALQRMIDIIRAQYECAGFAPIDTALVERIQVLTAKSDGEIGNQMYGLRLLNPSPDAMTDSKDLALRFDHTVPLARFIAANCNTLTFPFRRYAIGPVFRGERPKDGRYRQFIQADIDVIGDGSLSLLYDAEMVAVITGIFTKLAIGPFTTRISNRKVLQGLLQSVGLSEEKTSSALMAIDKIDKIGKETVVRMLTEMGIDEEEGKGLIALLTENRSTDETIALLRKRSLNPLFAEGVDELEKVIVGIRQFGVLEDSFCVDISIARGLDYYTGTVYETRFDLHPDLGSIASGGRYEDLAGTFIDRKLPGVGIAIGVTRLLLRLIKAKLFDAGTTTIAPVIVTTAMDIESERNAFVYLDQVRRLRAADIATEIYLMNRQLGKQMQFADRRGFRIAVITREENIENNTVVVRNLKSGEQQEVSSDKLVESVKEMLSQ